MRMLVTGASGLIGGHIVKLLVARGHQVKILTRPSTRKNLFIGLPTVNVTGDILNFDEALRNACTDCDMIFHTAAHFAYAGISSNQIAETATEGTANILKAAREKKVPRVVVTSSSVVFGYNLRPEPIDEMAGLASPEREPDYVRAKIAQHQCALQLGEEFGIEVLLPCPTMTLGVTDSTLGPSNGIITSYLYDPFRCTFPGGCNLVGVSDVADGHVLIGLNGRPGESYLLGGENLSWAAVHSVIGDLTGAGRPTIKLSHTAAYLAATVEELRARAAHRKPRATRAQATMVGRHYWYSHVKAGALGYAPKPISDVLLETVSWLVTSPHISREIRTQLKLSDEIHEYRARQALEKAN